MPDHRCDTGALPAVIDDRRDLQGGTTGAMMESLARGLGALRGGTTTVKRLERHRFEGSSSFATERLHATLGSGEQIDVFFKDLNPRNLLEEAQAIRQEGLERSRRELLTYKNVLARLDLGTPALYGSRWEPAEDRYWIFLEDAGPKRLSRLGDFRLWVEATAWIAKLHAVDPAALGEAANFLPRYEPGHFDTCEEQVQDNLARFSPEDRHIVKAALDRYRECKAYLRRLPTCLIHGEYFGKNVMIRSASPARQVAAIDWETAAIGPRCVDLVSIMAGRWTSLQRGVMCRAYASAFTEATGRPVDLAELHQEIAHVGLYRALWWLGYWSRGDDAHIARWMKELEAVLVASSCPADVPT